MAQKTPYNRLAQYNKKLLIFWVFSHDKNTTLEKSLCVFATHEHKPLTERHSQVLRDQTWQEPAEEG